MAARKRTASRGFVNNIILESLLSGDKYGYEIIKEVEEKSNGKIILKQPSLYSSLKRFETKGYITSYWGDSDIGGRRHYYTITEIGKNYYNKTVNKSYDLDDEDDVKNNNSIETEQLSFEENSKIDNLKEIINENNLDSSNEQISANFEDNSFIQQKNDQTIEENKTTSEDYNIFDILENEKSSTKTTLQKSSNEKKAENSFDSKIGSIKENSIQVDMFENNKTENEINKEEDVNIQHIQQLKLNDMPRPAENVNKLDIPLIKEQTQEFFSWEDLKRKQVAEKVNTEKENETENKPINNQIVIDEFGILKMGDPNETIKQQKIFDNVGVRIDYKDPVIKPEPKKEIKHNFEPELTDEERELKNKKFNEKFEDIVSQKSNTENQTNKEIDYKNILGDLLAPEQEDVIEDNFNNEQEISNDIIENALNQVQNYNYTANTTSKTTMQSFNEDGFKFKPFITEVDEDEKQTNFVLTNKVKLNYGIFMFVLMILQISALFVILKAKNLLYTSDYVLYGVAYGIALFILLFCVITYLIAPDKRKANTFKLSYSLIFGILLFLSACALTYAINTFTGLNSSNVTLFSSKILLPIIISINFVLTPLIYKMILSDKKMY